MKKIITLTSVVFTTILGIAAWNYTGPMDERMPPGYNDYDITLGWLAQHADIAAVANVITDIPGEPPEVIELENGMVVKNEKHSWGCFTIQVTNAIYGCTNGQEFVLGKFNPKSSGSFRDALFDPNFEYYPTNHSRIVVVGIREGNNKSRSPYTPKDWKLPPEPETIVSSTNAFVLYDMTRNWWYDGYQDNLPYTHLTNLVQVTRRERNWTNYYHVVRDAIPSSSERVWGDSFEDMMMLLRVGTQGQYDYIMGDPLFPVECQEMLQDYYVRIRRYSDDE